MFLSSLAYILGRGSRPQYEITEAASSVNEGATLTFTVNTKGVPNSTLYWTINFNSASSQAADFGAVNGSFTTTSNTGSFTVGPIADLTTEGAQTFFVELRTGSITGTIVARSNIITINDTSLTPTAAFTVAPTSVNEAATVNYSVSTTNYPSGTLYWTITHGTTAAADFSASSGSFTVTGSAGTFSITTIGDQTTEGAQTCTISVRLGSITGTVLATTGTITINDTSTTPVATFTTTPANIAETPQTVTFAVSVSSFPSGTLYWTINHITTAAADFTASSGSFTITAGVGSFTITSVADVTTEGSQTFTVSIRLTSITGTVIGTSSTVTVDDTSLTAPGQLLHQLANSVQWTCPATVNSVSIACIAGGGGGVGLNSQNINQGGAGGAGALCYRNNVAVTPGVLYILSIPQTAAGVTGGNPYFGAVGATSIGGNGAVAQFGPSPTSNTTTLCAAPGGRGGRGLANDTTPYTGVLQGGYGGGDPALGDFRQGTIGIGGRGGFGGGLVSAGGGGTGGYGTIGGAGAGTNITTPGAGGGSGAGAGGARSTTTLTTGVNGSGASILGTTPGGGTLYGGGGAAGRGVSGIRGGNGAIRIMWPGQTRAYPATNAGNL